MLLFSVLGFSASARAADAAAVLQRYKSASGGPRWDTTHSWRGDGRMSAGGLSGEFHITVDLRDGRSVDAYQLGTIKGADGYDGTHGWERDPGGEVAALDTPDALRRARTQAWLDAHAYWYPQRIAATLGKGETRMFEGRRYDVITATPKDGDPVTLWFDAATGLLARTVQQQGPDSVTVQLHDYRDAGGVRLPFHSITDLTDAAGRTDSRRRIEVTFEHVALDVPVADADFAPPRMTQTASIYDASGVATIDFDLIGNHIYVDGRIDGKAARFLVDTGGVNMLTPAAARKFGIVGEGKLAASGSGDERVDVSFAHTREVRVGAAALAQPVFYIIDVGELEAAEGVSWDGLVGYELFRRFGVRIDYAARKLVLSEPAKFTPPPGAHMMPFTLDDRTPIVGGTLDGVPLRISIDTGARSSLTLHAPFAREHDLITRYQAAPEAVLGWGVGGPSRERPARFGRLMLGDVAIDGIAGEIHTSNKGSFANPGLGGNLGGGVLRRFTVGFDYANRKMYLAPNADSAQPDAFDRSGVWLIADADALKIVDVAPDSAAQRAGLRVNDKVISIGGEPVMRRLLPEWRQQLRELPAGTKLAIAIQRDGAQQTVQLTLADRMPARAPK